MEPIPRQLVFVTCCPRGITDCVASPALHKIASECDAVRSAEANLSSPAAKARAMSCNVQRTVEAYGAPVVQYDDARCVRCIRDQHGAALAEAFVRRMVGNHKTDLCRVCALFEHGGCYADNDMYAVVSLWPLLPAGTTIASVLSTGSKSNKFPTLATMQPELTRSLPPPVRRALNGKTRADIVQLFNSLICAAPRHPVLARAMNWSRALEFTSSAAERRARLALLPIHPHFRTLDLEYRELNTATLARAWVEWNGGRPLRTGWDADAKAFLFAEISLLHPTATLLGWRKVLPPEWLWQRHGCEYAVLDFHTGQVPWLGRHEAVGVDAHRACGGWHGTTTPLTLSPWESGVDKPGLGLSNTASTASTSSSFALQLGSPSSPPPVRVPGDGPQQWQLHRLAPHNVSRWARWMRSWQAAGAERLWHDEDIEPMVRAVVPQHAERILAMRSPVERNDMVRYAILWKYGGVYADLDIELRAATRLHRLVSYAMEHSAVLLPTETMFAPTGRMRQAGQCLMVSSPRHPFWLALIDELVGSYNASCYEPTNTGPGAITLAYNRLCHNFSGVTPLDELMEGSTKVTMHHPTGSWREVGARSRFASKGEMYDHYKRSCPQRQTWTGIAASCRARRIHIT